jgi:16S rRNA (adenine1518-N6/adenine1519-N6)-dimethyltransferase
MQTADVGPQDVVFEVGPGLGEMTLALAHEARKVLAVEIDRKLVEILMQKVSGLPNVEVIQSDILRLDFPGLFGGEEGPVKVVANLPYQISTPLLFRFVDSREVFSSLTLMIQREVAERMIAAPGSKDYGPLSVLVQALADILVCFHVKSSAFLGYRRKTLINALNHSGLVLPLDLKERLAEIHVDLRRRPETLTIDEFIQLATILKSTS